VHVAGACVCVCGGDRGGGPEAGGPHSASQAGPPSRPPPKTRSSRPAPAPGSSVKGAAKSCSSSAMVARSRLCSSTPSLSRCCGDTGRTMARFRPSAASLLRTASMLQAGNGRGEAQQPAEALSGGGSSARPLTAACDTPPPPPLGRAVLRA
jgi:hypothetical protein